MTAQPLRSRNWFGRRDLDGFVHRSWLKTEGFSDLVFDGRPVVGIAAARVVFKDHADLHWGAAPIPARLLRQGVRDAAPPTARWFSTWLPSRRSADRWP